jgi:hypothetical protein
MEDLFLVRDKAARGAGVKMWKQSLADEEWVQSDTDAPFAFTWVCYHLGFKPEAIRYAYFTGQAQPKQE